MSRTALLHGLVLGLVMAAPVFAQDSKEVSCDYQAQVVAAIQQARLDRIRERKVPEHIAKSEPTWPENYNAAIPIMAPWVYEQKMRDIRNQDLAATWKELCLKQG